MTKDMGWASLACKERTNRADFASKCEQNLTNVIKKIPKFFKTHFQAQSSTNFNCIYMIIDSCPLFEPRFKEMTTAISLTPALVYIK